MLPGWNNAENLLIFGLPTINVLPPLVALLASCCGICFSSVNRVFPLSSIVNPAPARCQGVYQPKRQGAAGAML